MFVKVDKIEDAVLFVGDDPLGLKDLSYDELCTLRIGIASSIEKAELWIEQLEKQGTLCCPSSRVT